MQTLEDILELARQLTADERRRLLEGLAKEDQSTASAQAGPYDPLLELAGTVESDLVDVSSNKAAHVAEAYTDKG